jgi:hypothetical protein
MECECTTHLHGKEVLKSLKERKSKVNSLLIVGVVWRYWERERERHLGYQRNPSWRCWEKMNLCLEREKEVGFLLRRHSQCYCNLLLDVTGGEILQADNLSLLQMFEGILVIDTLKNVWCKNVTELFFCDLGRIILIISF